MSENIMTNNDDGVIPAILVLGTSANPIHMGHFQALHEARRQVEAATASSSSFKVQVQAAYLACAPDGYCRKKYGSDGYLPADHRLALCNLLLESVHDENNVDGTPFVRPTTRTYGSAQECGLALIRHDVHTPNTRIYVVVGDEEGRGANARHHRNKSVQIVTYVKVPHTSISSTAIRQSMANNKNGGDGSGLDHAIAQKWIPASFRDYHNEHDQVMNVFLNDANHHQQKNHSDDDDSGGGGHGSSDDDNHHN